MTEALRSPGSTLKPFIYAMAFGDGLAHPETLLDDVPGALRRLEADQFRRKVPWLGDRARRRCNCRSTCRRRNCSNEIGPARFVARMRSAGLPLVLPKDSDAGLAIGLGGVGVRLRDLARALCRLFRAAALRRS